MVIAKLRGWLFGSKKEAPEWSDIPDDVRRKVIGELDLRSRFRMRVCSKSHVSLVDSTPLSLPRVNFFCDRTKSGALTATVMFFMKADRYIRLEFRSSTVEETWTIIGRTMKLKSVHEDVIPVPNEHPLKLAARVLRTVCCHAATRLDGLEVDVGGLENDELMTLNTALGPLNVSRFRVTLINFTCETSDVLLLARLDEKCLQAVEINIARNLYAFVHDPKNGDCAPEGPMSVLEFFSRGCHNVRRYYSTRKTDNVKMMMKIDLPYKSATYQHESGGIPSFHTTRCGTVADALIYVRWSESFREVMPPNMLPVEPLARSPKCLHRWSCPVHASPFTHWYYKRGRFQCVNTLVRYQSDFWETIVPVKDHARLLRSFLLDWRRSYSALGFSQSRLDSSLWPLVALIVLLSLVLVVIFYVWKYVDDTLLLRFINTVF